MFAQTNWYALLYKSCFFYTEKYFFTLFSRRMPNSLDLVDKNKKILNLLDKNIESIKEFVDVANSRLDCIVSIINNSHAIAADAVTAMICENQDSLASKNSVNTTNKMSVCLRDGEIIIRYVTYLLVTNDESIFEKSCLKDLKSTYLALGVPLPNAIRVVELIKDATISEIVTTVNSECDEKSFMSELIDETEIYFQKIIDLFN